MSSLSFISKFFEKVVLQQLVDYLHNNNLLCSSQSAYRPHHSTETLLLKTANDIILGLDKRHVPLSTLLDLSSAFDAIDHNILLSRLNYLYGISCTCLSWFRSYLLNRRQSVATECLPMRPNKCTQYLDCTSLSLGHNFISLYTKARSLGFHLTDDMRTEAHIQDICRKAYIDIRRISSIRRLLTNVATKTLLSAFVPPKLDNCNSLFYGNPMYMLERLQKVQNSAARLIFQCRKQNHISPLLMSLHWLPINARIEYKLSVICHSLYLSLSPIYLSGLLSLYTPKRNLRFSSDNRILCIPML